MRGAAPPAAGNDGRRQPHRLRRQTGPAQDRPQYNPGQHLF